ncbi:glycerophosphodiester phosphodiesterase [Oerskovia enterophila]|uniref:Glycerophosphoryl diester phosphodiesterase n=1 Tax=Oerskovia enterophila TaxID=43678 RepID=A0ABX2Y2T5_9CELL|nr:glycerophosphodiester phosphodiesterase family protein [Oerskovia enterophila]OCI30800.1 glycerophosphoryl diester phosphodiesterase [Oerskovia enterophila]
MTGAFQVVAHRGNSSVAPQNTLAAFEAAWRAGADSIELDVQLTADGEVVVIHDDTLDATTDGSGRVDGLPLADVRAVDAGSWFAPAYAGQRVPTFAEVVDLLVTRPGIDLLLEVKGDWGPDDVRKVTEPVLRAGLADRVIGQSFWPSTVASLQKVAPDLRRGLLVERSSDDLLATCAELGVMTCNPAGTVLLEQPGLVAALHDAGLEVMVWTLNEPEQWALALEVGVDAVITDRPDRLRGWLSGN